MICRQHLPRVFCFSFILIFCGLFFTGSFTMANDTEWQYEYEEHEFQCNGEHSAHVYRRNDSGIMEIHSKNLLPSNLHDFTFKNITVILDIRGQLSCSWSTASLPRDAQYSVIADLPDRQMKQHLKCSHIVAHEAIECHGLIDVEHESECMVVKVNISLPEHWYIIQMDFETINIRKLDPPNNINISVSNSSLDIKWTLPEDEWLSKNSDCYQYQLKINDEVQTAHGKLQYTKQDIDRTRKYAIQIRVMYSDICITHIPWSKWSEWSDVREVGPVETVNPVNPWVIAVIVLVIPMFLLSFLLLCKFQRLHEKLFPPIPSPSVNAKKLLEKDDFYQNLPAGCVEHVTEIYME